MKAMFIGGLAAALLAACASGPPRVDTNQTLERYQSYAGEPVDRFSFTRIDSWEALDDSHIVLRSGRDGYLLTVYATCRDLRYANAIGVVSAMGHTLSRFDKIKVGRDTCPIREIRPLDIGQMKADEEALKKYREADKAGGGQARP
jgi:hypothetical protein